METFYFGAISQEKLSTFAELSGEKFLGSALNSDIKAIEEVSAALGYVCISGPILHTNLVL